MGEHENKIIAFLLQDSTILGIITVLAVIWNFAVPEASVEAILTLAATGLALQQFLKDSTDAIDAKSIVVWFFQPTTLRAIVLSGSVLVKYTMTEVQLSTIVEFAALLLGMIQIVSNELTRKLLFKE